MAMKELTIEYFPLYGRAECIRLMCASAGVKVINKPITPEEWANLKGKGDYATGGLP